MELRHLRYFQAVAEQLNFTRAAARLGIGQPPLSQQIRDLEKELGVDLFLRTPHGVELTEAGKAFQTEVQPLLGGVTRACELAQRAARGESGQLRLGFTASSAFTTIVPSTIRNFRRSYPQVRLEIEESNTITLLERLDRRQLDAAFVRYTPVRRSGIRFHRFADEPMMVALPSSHPLAGRERVPLQALREDPFVLFPRAVGISLHDAITTACRAAGFEPQVTQEVLQITSIVSLVASELGVSIVPASIAALRVKGVHFAEIDGTPPMASLTLALPERSNGSLITNFLAAAGIGEGATSSADVPRLS